VQPVDLAAGDLGAANLEADLLQARLRMLLGVKHDNPMALPVVPSPLRRRPSGWDNEPMAITGSPLSCPRARLDRLHTTDNGGSQ
jgi:hypothetical protein